MALSAEQRFEHEYLQWVVESHLYWLTEAEASALLMATRENVRRMIWSGRLVGERLQNSSAYRISERSVRRLLDEGGYVPGITQPGE